MSTVYLRRSDLEFWDMTMRQVVAMIDQWRDIEKNRDMMRAYLANGGDPETIGVSKAESEEKNAELGNAMW